MKFHLNLIFIIKLIIMSILNKLQQAGSILNPNKGTKPSNVQLEDIIPTDSNLGLKGITPSKYSDNQPQ